MRVYISGPISGNLTFREDFQRAEEKLTEEGYEVINPAKVGDKLPPLKYEEFMKIDLAMLELCDAICMLRGWEKSPGCNREYGYAMGKDIAIMHISELEGPI